jgi:phosphoribosylglycinamide formyltransferase-1
MMKKFKVIVCSSGGGGNFQALIDAREAQNFEISLLIVDNDCGAIKRAKVHGIPVNRVPVSCSQTTKIEFFLKNIPCDTDLIILAGFMPIIPKEICDVWKYKIINTHPSLLPKYGGKGMVGVKVQEAVMNANEVVAGCTVHYVNEKIDDGEIILQKVIKVNYSESAWQLGGRVFKEEAKLLVQAVKLLKSRK